MRSNGWFGGFRTWRQSSFTGNDPKRSSGLMSGLARRGHLQPGASRAIPCEWRDHQSPMRGAAGRANERLGADPEGTLA
jgi:hypothetical protein